MESRKAIVRKLFYDSGVKEGKRMVREVEEMRGRWDYLNKEYLRNYEDKIRELSNEIENNSINLVKLLFNEVSMYAPKRIRNYLDKVLSQTIDDAIGEFNTYLKELTYIYYEEPAYPYKEIIPPSESEELLKIYNKLLDKTIKKSESNYPKGIATYCQRMTVQQDTIIRTLEEEGKEKAVVIYYEERDKDLDPLINKFINRIHDTCHDIRRKAFYKLRRIAEKDIYNIKKPMGEEGFSKFMLKCGSEEFCNGLFREYNRDTISGIYPFSLDTAPLLHPGSIKHLMNTVKEAEEDLAETFREEAREEYVEGLFE